jgi:zinc protease
MRPLTLAASLIVLLSAWPGLAQEKELPPEGAPPKPFQSPKRQNFTLPNGLHVSVAHYGLIPKINMELALNGGDITEPEGKQGVSGLMGELMKEGTTTRSAQEIADQTGLVGGELSINASSDQIVVHGEGLSEGADKLVALLADLALHPKFPESELGRIKQNQLRLIAIAKSTPRMMATEQFQKIIYGDNGYGRALPDEKMLQAITVADIKAYYAQHFVPANATLYVTGVFDDNLRKSIETAFSSWTKGTPPKLPQIAAKTNHTLAVVNRPGASQSTIYMGLPVITPGSKDFIPLEVTDSILGGSFMSRITSNIREEKGYTYSPRSSIESNLQDAVWAERADVTTQFTGASLSEILKEVNRLRTQAPPEKELQGIQNGMAGVFILRNSSRQGIINMLKFVDVHHLPANYLDNYIPTMFAVKPPDVQGMMEKYVDPNKMTIVVVGDQVKIDSQLTPFKPQ